MKNGLMSYFLLIWLMTGIQFVYGAFDAKRLNPSMEEILRGNSRFTKARKSDKVTFYDSSSQFGLEDQEGSEFHIWMGTFPSFGEPWPLPLNYQTSNSYLELLPEKVTFTLSHSSNYILKDAIYRCKTILFHQKAVSFYPLHWLHQERFVGHGSMGADSVTIVVNVSTEGRPWPHLHMDESYELIIKKTSIHLNSRETWGALRGLEILSQLVWQTSDGRLFVNSTRIFDKPNYPYRGLMLDTARHFIHKSVILKNLDAMSMHHLNVFHWHIVDDQSFPFVSETFPELSEKGAFGGGRMVYTHSDVKEIVEYARQRGIRVIPEFDSPGHTFSWGKAFPQLLTRCYNNGGWSGYYGPINPANNFTYEFLSRLYDEILQLFPDEFIHLGADEVGTSCWYSNPDVRKVMEENKIDSIENLGDFYLRKLQNLITNKGRHNKSKTRGFMFWQEPFDRKFALKNNSIIHLWKSSYIEDEESIRSMNLRLIFSTCWYVDQLSYGVQWAKFYNCEIPTLRSASLSNALLGGEAAMWTEYQSNETVLARLWPLVSAVSERLWTTGLSRSLVHVGERLDEQRCRLMLRGIPVGVASGPGICPHEVYRYIKNDEWEESSSLPELLSLEERLLQFMQSPRSQDVSFRASPYYQVTFGQLLGLVFFPFILYLFLRQACFSHVLRLVGLAFLQKALRLFAQKRRGVFIALSLFVVLSLVFSISSIHGNFHQKFL